MKKRRRPKKREAPTAAKPFDWDKYLAEVRKSAEEAEQHLVVPPGTITSIAAEQDFIATVKTYAVIEPMLNDLIVSHTPLSAQSMAMGLGQSLTVRENFRTFVTHLNMSGRTGKLRLAEALGLLPGHHIDFIEAVTRVRNRYAHNVKNMHKSLIEILTEEQPHQGQIAAHLTGLQARLPFPPGLDTNVVRWIEKCHVGALATHQPVQVACFARVAA